MNVNDEHRSIKGSFCTKLGKSKKEILHAWNQSIRIWDICGVYISVYTHPSTNNIFIHRIVPDENWRCIHSLLSSIVVFFLFFYFFSSLFFRVVGVWTIAKHYMHAHSNPFQSIWSVSHGSKMPIIQPTAAFGATGNPVCCCWCPVRCFSLLPVGSDPHVAFAKRMVCV